MYNYIKKTIIWLFIFVMFFINTSNIFAARDIMDVMFQPAKWYEKIIDLGSTKNAVGNNVFKEAIKVWVNENGWFWCFVNWQLIWSNDLEKQISDVWYKWDKDTFCEEILWWDVDISFFGAQKQAPLIVRITKFLLRITIVLAITMVLYNGIFWVIESAKWGDVKDAKNNIIYIIWWVLLALSSVALINIVSSITLSSLNPDDMPQKDDSFVINKPSWWGGWGWGGIYSEPTENNYNEDNQWQNNPQVTQNVLSTQ